MTVPFPSFPTPSVEHEIQREMLKRLGIEWTPGEPFVALVEDEIVRLRSFADVGVYSQLQTAQAEIKQLQAAYEAMSAGYIKRGREIERLRALVQVHSWFT